ncbi:MAG: hypothetical protein Q9M92_06290 [Enterobacterales bacterium]|nr:hypothetical protein [Enterobacterales bacterium]
MRLFTYFFLLGLCFNLAAEQNSHQGKNKSGKPTPKAATYITKHQIKIAGKNIKYEATAGTLLIKNDQDEAIALFGFTAYVSTQSKQSNRPIVFAYNGGPGSASIWLHMGVLGPQRAIINDTGFTNNGPFKRVSNQYSILDEADLVMIDPIGTGFSKFIGKAKGSDFWGVDQDINSVGDFIAQYITENKRWASPKFILGESYWRVCDPAGLSLNLLNKHNIALNGVILVSPFLDFITGFDIDGIDLPHILFLPAFAATAEYHKALKNQPNNRDSFLREVEKFATGEYASALMQGSMLDHKTREHILDKLQAYSGLSRDYWDRANLRVGHQQFVKELLRDRKQTVGRIDSRFKGESIILNADSMQYDPMTTSIGPSYLAAFMDYYSKDLKVPAKQKYAVFGNVFTQWDWGHRQPGAGFKLPMPNTSIDLAYAMTKNPNMKVLFMQGYYDLATPYFTTKYLISHLNISSAARKNITEAYYDAGHMMYVHDDSLVKFKTDLAEFIKASY